MGRAGDSGFILSCILLARNYSQGKQNNQVLNSHGRKGLSRLVF
jgi:hypothetical protein